MMDEMNGIDEYGHLGSWYIKSTPYMRFFNWNKSFENKQVVTGEPRSLWSVHFVLSILFVLTFASDKAVSYGNVTFSILGLST